MFISSRRTTRGAAALIIVMILCSAGLLLAIGTAYLGLGEAEDSFLYSKNQDLLSQAEGCHEIALGALEADWNYPGETLPLSGYSCIITVTAVDADKKTIELQVDSGDYHKLINSQVVLVTGKVKISSWKIFGENLLPL